MKIVDVEAIVVKQPTIEDIGDGSQDTVVVRVHTDAGITGVGEADSSPYVVREIIYCPASHIVCKGLRDVIIGMDPFDIDVIYEKMYQASYYYGRRSAAIHAISAIEMALWDIKGKALGLPVYKLLGGAFRTEIPAYCSVLMPDSEDEIKRIVDTYMPQGYCGIKFGWGALGYDLDTDVKLIAACRKALGKGPRLMIDIGMRWTGAKTVIRMCERIREFDLTWLEEPFSPDYLDGYRRLATATDISIAAGEEQGTLYELMELLDTGGVDILQPDMARCGGIGIAKKISDIAALKDIPVIPHAFKTGILMSASLQFIAAAKNAFILEYICQETVLSKRLIKHHFNIDAHGIIHIPDQPGLGIEVDEDVLEEYCVLK